MFALASLFPDFASFYTFMAQKEHATTQTIVARALSPLLLSPSEHKDKERDPVASILPPNARVVSPPLSPPPSTHAHTQTQSTTTTTTIAPTTAAVLPKVKVPYLGNASVLAAVKGQCCCQCWLSPLRALPFCLILLVVVFLCRVGADVSSALTQSKTRGHRAMPRHNRLRSATFLIVVALLSGCRSRTVFVLLQCYLAQV